MEASRCIGYDFNLVVGGSSNITYDDGLICAECRHKFTPPDGRGIYLGHARHPVDGDIEDVFFLEQEIICPGCQRVLKFNWCKCQVGKEYVIELPIKKDNKVDDTK